MATGLEQLAGTWEVTSLEVDGAIVPSASFQGSKIVVRGSTFSTISMGAIYGGTIKIDETTSPKTLDLVFKSGPEKGNTSLAIFELDGDTWKLCLTVTGKTRPTSFATKPGSGLALETLKRQTGQSPEDRMKAELKQLQGTWSMVSGVKDGQELPAQFVKTASRLVNGNETSVLFGREVFLKAAFALGVSSVPKTIDYIITYGAEAGYAQSGIYKIEGDTLTFHFAPTGSPRPTEFTPRMGVGGTLTVWKRKKK